MAYYLTWLANTSSGGGGGGDIGGEDAPPTTTNNVYIRSGGTGSGTSWSDARSTLPTLARNTTYWLGGGLSMGNIDFNVANSGTTPVVIRKATIDDHGTDTGWSDSYASGQTTFGQIIVQKDYLYVYGATRNEDDWNNTSAYGFWINSVFANVDVGLTAGNYATFTYCDIGNTYDESPSAGTIAGYSGIPPFYMAGGTTKTGWRVNRCCVHNGKGTLFQGVTVDSMTVERCWIGPGWGKEAIRGQSLWTNNVVRWNFFYNSSQKDPNDGSSGVTAEIGVFSNSGGGGTYDGNQVYGNVIYCSIDDSGRNTVIVIGGDGGVTFDGNPGNNNKVFNNTIAGMSSAAVMPMIDLNGGTGNEARNNLFYDTVDSDVAANTTSNNVKATSDPFVNYAGLDFHITSGSQAQNAGTSISGTAYKLDGDGVIRGGDGTWDVGAYEYVDPATRYALSFPLNSSFTPGDGTSNSGNMTALIFSNPNTNGLGMWGASNTAGVTVIAEYQPIQQPGFYAPILWYSDDNSFNAGSIPYWGAGGLFPQNNSNLGTSHWWEGATDGNDWFDYLGREYSDGSKTPKVAVKSAWYTCGFRATRNNANSKSITWYTALPSVANADIINHTITTTSYGESAPPQPQLTIGDSPWYASFQHESLGGYLGRYKLFAGVLSEADMLAEAADMSKIVTTAGLENIWWFKPGFRSADDLTCEAGTGHTFSWFDTSKKATLVALP